MTAAGQASALSPQRTVRAHVDARLRDFLGETTDALVGISPVARTLMDPLRTFAEGGKRVRAVLLWWGYELAGGRDAEAIASAAGSVELLHAAALVHDDIIDASETRRGLPAVHARFRDRHRDEGMTGDAQLYGTSAGIIAGDLCLALSTELFESAGFPNEPVARAIRAALHRDVMLGQFLDVELETARVARTDVRARADEVLTHKTAQYTVVQPLVLGAALAGADARLRDGLAAFGLPLGRAFQLRDDALGVFGDPQLTGKPAGDDLVQGKRTLLVAEVFDRASTADADWFEERLGHPAITVADVSRMRAIIVDSGALAAFEQLIDAEAAESIRALDALSECGLAADDIATLRAFAHTLTDRQA